MPREAESMAQKIVEVSQKRKPRAIEYMRKVGQNVKDRLGHNESVSEMSMDSEKMHISTWTRFVASSMQATLDVNPSYEKNLEIFKNSEFESFMGLSSITRMMIGGNSEI